MWRGYAKACLRSAAWITRSIESRKRARRSQPGPTPNRPHGEQRCSGRSAQKPEAYTAGPVLKLARFPMPDRGFVMTASDISSLKEGEERIRRLLDAA